MSRKREDWLKDLEQLYKEVDRDVDRLCRLHSARLQCRRGCHSCCPDGLKIFEVEAESIRRHYRKLLEGEAPNPGDGCAFLDKEGACRIYAHRPYVCRTQGLPLRWVKESANGNRVEFRDICPLNDNDQGEPVEALPEDECWSLGPVEGRLARLQASAYGGKMTRIALRDLFPTPNLRLVPQD